MHTIDLITKKRDGKHLSKEEIEFLVYEYTKNNIPDYQMSAFLMAVYFQGMNDNESLYLASAMRDSGDVFDLSKIPGVKVDKHSTGGVGDKVTLVLGPLLAYHGAKVAKMSGRGLGHTGGTVDKLESIPGFQVERSITDFFKQVSDIGVSVVGQSGDVAPADKKLYALRDVTATVDSIPLIAASIMSKKLASGADVICLDVKVGKGAFMKTKEEARKLAQLMVEIGRLDGKKMTAVLTGMDEPLGHMIGNGLEVYESILTLKGQGPSDLIEVSAEIGAYLLLDAHLETSFAVAKDKLKDTLKRGLAYPLFEDMVAYQKGDLNFIRHPEKLFTEKTYQFRALRSGYVAEMDTLNIGIAAARLGAGRETKEDLIDYQVGLNLHKKIGDYVHKGDVLVTLYYNDNKGYQEALDIIEKAIVIADHATKPLLILDVIR